MNFFEKYTNSKFYYIVDQIFRIFLINVLTLITLIIGLGIFGLGPAIIASTLTTKMIYEKHEGPIAKVYFQIVKKYFVKSLAITLFFLVLIGIFIFNIVFFFNSLEVEYTLLGLIGIFLMTILLFLSVSSYVHALMMLAFYQENPIFKLIKNGFILTAGFIIRSLIFSILTFGLIILSVVIPILGLLLLFFLESSITYWCMLKAYKKVPNFDDRDNEMLNSIIY